MGVWRRGCLSCACRSGEYHRKCRVVRTSEAQCIPHAATATGRKVTSPKFPKGTTGGLSSAFDPTATQCSFHVEPTTWKLRICRPFQAAPHDNMPMTAQPVNMQIPKSFQPRAPQEFYVGTPVGAPHGAATPALCFFILIT